MHCPLHLLCRLSPMHLSECTLGTTQSKKVCLCVQRQPSVAAVSGCGRFPCCMHYARTLARQRHLLSHRLQMMCLWDCAAGEGVPSGMEGSGSSLIAQHSASWQETLHQQCTGAVRFMRLCYKSMRDHEVNTAAQACITLLLQLPRCTVVHTRRACAGHAPS